MRRTASTLSMTIGLLCAAAPFAAHAGGLEFPDNGTEALGRGGAFVAKADDGTALEYNIAGLARQRGTRLTLDANLIFHDAAFTRAGVYPGDPNEPQTPWAGKPYPTVHDKEGFFPAPFLGLSTDFGWFRRWTFALGVYGPSSVGKHDYGVDDKQVCDMGQDGKTTCHDPPSQVTLSNGTVAPGPARYDITKTNLLVVFPTLAVGVSPVRFLDLGVAVQMVYSNLSLANANYTPLGPSTCVGSRDSPNCDAYGQIDTSGITYTGLLSVLAHPTEWLDIGATVRPQANVSTTGKIHAVVPKGQPQLPDTDVTFTTVLPTWARVGARGVLRYADGTERADLELDLVYENWAADGCKDDLVIEDAGHKPILTAKRQTNCATHLHADRFALGPEGHLDVDIVHDYRDTYGVRLGGAYNYRMGDQVRLTGRLGGFFDSAASTYPYTRLDFNTQAKWGFTAGVGFKWRGLMLNIAYAFVYSPTRNVENSEVTAVSAINGTTYSRSDLPLLTIGNGKYEQSLQILSVGLTFNFSEFRRPTLFPN